MNRKISVRMKDFSDRLRHEMDSGGLTQSTLALRCGVSQSRVSDWLSGRSRPQPRTLKAIADTFGISPDWLINGEGPKLNKESERIGEQVRRTLPIKLHGLGSEPDIPSENPWDTVEREITSICGSLERLRLAVISLRQYTENETRK